MAKLSNLAHHMLNYHGLGRLKMMRSEYEAGLPMGMSAGERHARIAAIDEVMKHLAPVVKTKKK